MRNKLLVLGALVATAAISVGIGIAQGASSAPNTRSAHVQAPAVAFKTKAQTLFAVVNADGTLARGYGALSSKHLNPGHYEVLFKRGLRKCAYTLTLGSSGSSGSPPIGYGGVVGRNGAVTGVYVETYNSGGAATDAGFHMIVACPPLA